MLRLLSVDELACVVVKSTKHSYLRDAVVLPKKKRKHSEARKTPAFHEAEVLLTFRRIQILGLSLASLILILRKIIIKINLYIVT
jgi:hypothetical protein